jgi:hypothetical protein
MPSKTRVREVHDGLCNGGEITQYSTECDVCHAKTICVVMHPNTYNNLKLMGIMPEKTILKPRLGIGCGCYAKFHRQVAHIRERRHQRSRLATTG